MQPQSIKPTILTYNALVSACEQGKDLSKALQLLEDMQPQGIKPDIVAYNALVSACEKGEDLSKALQLFEAPRHQARHRHLQRLGQRLREGQTA